MASAYAIERPAAPPQLQEEDKAQEYSAPTTEEGGFDIAWPDLEPANLRGFGQNACQMLKRKGYCTVQMFYPHQTQDVVKKMAEGTHWTQPRAEFDEAFLGRGVKSIVRWVTEEPSLEDYLEAHIKSMEDLNSILAPFSGDDLDFTLAPSPPQQVMLRRRAEKGMRHTNYTSGSIEVEMERTEKLIRFFQDRRLCVMSIVTCENGGALELQPRRLDSGLGRATISVAAGLMIVFRHDLLSYSYKPNGPDLVLQAWLMQMMPKLEVHRIEGSAAEVMSVVKATGRDMIDSREVKILSLSGYIAGKTFGFQRTRKCYFAGTDTLVEIPKTRWDHDLYYSPQVQDGLATCKHTGCIHDDYLLTFDPVVFGYDIKDAEAFTIPLMKSFEVFHDTLHQSGKTKENMRGERFYWTIGDAERDIHKEERGQKSTGHMFSNYHLVPLVIAYHFGTHGTAESVDTACSASMTAYACLMQELKRVRDGKESHRLDGSMDYRQGCVGGNTCCPHPLPYIGMSQARMLGPLGRSVTFDMSANGFIRGEAFVGIYFKQSNNENEGLQQLAAAVGASCNQDGRSASLTAPNGPSQTLCVRICMRDINRHPHEVSITELHGTGTALGDPIEVSSTRALMVSQTLARTVPLLHTAGKSQTGHTELAAGCCGLIRTVICVYCATSTPNCHIRNLNQNIEDSGYPAIFPSEAIDLGAESLHAGVNSFGFGGTNARADLWAMCKSGPRQRAMMALHPTGQAALRLDARPDMSVNDSTSGVFPASDPSRNSIRWKQAIDMNKVGTVLVECPKCEGQMCWLCKEAHIDGAHRCTQVRHEAADYSVCSDCYVGGYLVSQPVEESIQSGSIIYMLSSWCWWQPVQMMQKVDVNGDLIYTHTFRLGKDRQPKFVLCLDRAMKTFIHPIKKDSSQDRKIIGPGYVSLQDRKNWLINADEDGAPEGATYEILFSWNKKMRISWDYKR